MKQNKCTCDVTVIHEEIVNQVINQLPSLEEIDKMSKLFKVLGDNTRLKIINALLKTEMCVCDISYLLNMSQSLISHQLRVLKDARLVKYRRSGKVVYYSLDDEHIEVIVKYALEHINESGEGDERK